MRVAVTGASGNVGSAVLRALAAAGGIDVVALARRPPEGAWRGVRWIAADVRGGDLASHFSGADAVIHLAWLIQPSRNRELIRSVNVEGSRRVFQAAAAAGVRTLVHASSVGVYSPGPKDRAVAESWPRRGVRGSFYSEDKVTVEDLLDSVESAHPQLRVVRLRPGLIFQREAATEIASYFLGPLVPMRLLRAGSIPLLPMPATLRFQVVHADDVAQAYLAAITQDVRGAFNIAAEPVLDRSLLAELLGAREVNLPEWLLRAGAAASYRLHLQPTEPGWVDMAVAGPVMDASRARAELGWRPRRSSGETIIELFSGFASRRAGPTPVLGARR
ncbi:MAG: NAD-dependent epimerase/dehydratase family protein [Mycobacteriales bacterium]